VRVYRTADRIMVAAPMPGLEPPDIMVIVDGDRLTIEGKERGPHQHERDLMRAEWTIGPYYRELELLHPVRADLVNATYDNGVLVLAMPTLDPGQPRVLPRFVSRLSRPPAANTWVMPARPQPMTTPQHRVGKHEASPASPLPRDRRGIRPPPK
jgi:hypothetical protein